MKFLMTIALACASCTSTRVSGFFEHDIGTIRDPEALADLRTIADQEACWSCESASSNRQQGAPYASYMSPSGRLAACIVTVATYQSPAPAQLSLYVTTYEPFSRDAREHKLSGCEVCAQDDNDKPLPAALQPLQVKYLGRCSAESKDHLTHTLEAELPIDAAAARTARDHDDASFGEKLAYTDLKLAWIDELGRDPAFIARARADLGELRYGVYGPTAMQAAFAHDPGVAPAREEIDRLQKKLSSMTPHTETEIALQRDQIARTEELQAAISTQETRYSFSASAARVKAYETASETVQIKQRLSQLKTELVDVRDAQRADALAAEQRQLEAQLVALRKQHGITWSIF
jgi:hypothetical protein